MAGSWIYTSCLKEQRRRGRLICRGLGLARSNLPAELSGPDYLTTVWTVPSKKFPMNTCSGELTHSRRQKAWQPEGQDGTETFLAIWSSQQSFMQNRPSYLTTIYERSSNHHSDPKSCAYLELNNATELIRASCMLALTGRLGLQGCYKVA